MTGGLGRGGRYQLRQATMVDLIRTAYGINADNVVGGPAWLESDRFDIFAQAPPNTSMDAIPGMLQALLADRFGLVLHKDTKPLPSFVLSAGKGKPNLKEAVEGGGAPGCSPEYPQGPPPAGTIPMLTVNCHSVTLQAFGDAIHNFAGGYLTSPVVDATGLKGNWDITIRWNGRGTNGVSIFEAVEKQLNLKLEFQKYPSAVMVVDKVNEQPTPNPPGLSTKMPPPPPAEFEVADIKPAQPGSPQRGGGFMPGGRIDLRGFPLKQMVAAAWELPPNSDIPGAPKWMDTAQFDLIAKVATAGPITNPNAPPIAIDDLRAMLRHLLEERFKLKAHFEDRPMNAYTLVAAKPKMKKADPENRTGCKSGPAPMVKDAPPGLPMFQAVCQNITMAEFASRLQQIAPVYLTYAPTDATGIEGRYDFTLAFSPIPPNMMGGGGRRGGDGVASPTINAPPATAGGGATPEASEPVAALSLFDALTRQLGLKLEMQKRSLPVLVIDHIEEKPTDN